MGTPGAISNRPGAEVKSWTTLDSTVSGHFDRIDRRRNGEQVARKLKTYTTSIGFYDLAIAAPSMKAALEAWGTAQNLFHQGLAEESDDPDIVSATLAQPGIVLRRPVGSKGIYKEKPDAPKSLPLDAPPLSRTAKKKPSRKSKPAKPGAQKADKAAILSFEKAKAKRDAARREQKEREEAERKKDEARNARAVAKADEALARAKDKHEDIMAKIEAEREKVDLRAEAERRRWEDERRDLEAARKRARE